MHHGDRAHELVVAAHTWRIGRPTDSLVSSLLSILTRSSGRSRTMCPWPRSSSSSAVAHAARRPADGSASARVRCLRHAGGGAPRPRRCDQRPVRREPRSGSATFASTTRLGSRPACRSSTASSGVASSQDRSCCSAASPASASRPCSSRRSARLPAAAAEHSSSRARNRSRRSACARSASAAPTTSRSSPRRSSRPSARPSSATRRTSA